MNTEFIKLDFNTIANVSSIDLIKRIYNDNFSYTSFIEKYNKLLMEVVEKYLVDHITEFVDEDEDTITQKLFDKFAPVVRKNVIEDLGYEPDPYICSYVVRMRSGEEISIDEDTYNKLSEIINVKFDPIIQEPLIND